MYPDTNLKEKPRPGLDLLKQFDDYRFFLGISAPGVKTGSNIFQKPDLDPGILVGS